MLTRLHLACCWLASSSSRSLGQRVAIVGEKVGERKREIDKEMVRVGLLLRVSMRGLVVFGIAVACSCLRVLKFRFRVSLAVN